MTFTVEDFHDLLALLARRPEWRAELRRHILDDELLELPALVRQLADSQARTEQQIAALVEAQARTEQQVAALVEAQTRAEARLSAVETRVGTVEERLTSVDAQLRKLVDVVMELAAEQGRTTTRLGSVDDRVGDIDGRVLEHDFARRGPAYLSSIARRLRVLSGTSLVDLLDDAVDDGRLTLAERDEIMLADVVLSGRRRETGEDVYVVVEVSGCVGPSDVERAADRAALLAKLGRPVVPVAAGRRIDDVVAGLARDRGVWSALAGLVTVPRSA